MNLPFTPTLETAVERMDAAALAPIAGRVIGRPVTVIDWQVRLLGGLDSSPFAGGVYKVSGTAATLDGGWHDWTAVVKILRSPAGLTMPDGSLFTEAAAENPRDFAYWRREALVAQSGLPDRLPAGLRAPRFLGLTEAAQGELWLWQEYVPADEPWTMADYRDAAFRLGRWQAAGASRIKDAPWLSDRWLAGWVHGPLTNILWLVEKFDGWHHPLLTGHFAAGELTNLGELWAGRQATLDRLAALPQTLAHLDAHRGNLSRQDDGLVLLDWAFLGRAAVGEELAGLVGGTLLLDFVSLDHADALEAAAFDGYLAGLRAGGWAGDPAVVAEAYRCSLALRYGPISAAGMLRTVFQPDYAAEWEQKEGRPLADILARRAGFVRFLLARRP